MRQFRSDSDSIKQHFLALVESSPKPFQWKTAKQGLILELVKSHPRLIKEADKSLSDNEDFMLRAIAENADVLFYADKSLSDNEDFMLRAIAVNGLALGYADKSLRAQENVVLVAVKQNGLALEYAHESLRAKENVVLVAVEQNGLALAHAHKSLRAKENVVLVAVKQNGSALAHADESLTKDASFFWRVWHIHRSVEEDISRKSYINRYFLKETYKILLGAGLTMMALGLLLSSISTLPFPALLILIAPTAVGAIYTFNKLAEHSYGFFKARPELSTPVTENVLTI